MAFTSAIIHKGVIGSRKVVRGTFTNTAASTGGDIATGLKRVENIKLTHTGSAVVASAPVANETFPAPGTVTIVTVADADGIWEAVGK